MTRNFIYWYKHDTTDYRFSSFSVTQNGEVTTVTEALFNGYFDVVFFIRNGVSPSRLFELKKTENEVVWSNGSIAVKRSRALYNNILDSEFYHAHLLVMPTETSDSIGGSSASFAYLTVLQGVVS